MSRQIIKKDNGLYAIWSTIVDNFVYDDITKEQYLEIRISEETDRVRKDLKQIFESIDNGRAKEVYYQFVMTYGEAKKKIKNE